MANQRSRPCRLIPLLVLLTACTGMTIPPPPASAPDIADARHQTAIAASRDVLRPLLTEYPGLSVAVSVEGRIVWSEGLGWADIAASKPVTAATRFRIYSNSKPVTAATALRLAAAGRLDLDAPIGRYLGSLPPALAPLTMRQLLGHVAGIRHYRKGEWLTVSTRGCATAAEALGPFIDDPPLAAPNTQFHYSSFGYVLASAVIEAVEREPFLDVVQREILTPAAMKDTLSDAANRGAGAATPYEPARRGVKPAIAVDNSCKLGGGGLASTSSDLVRFGNALLDGTLLPARDAAVLFASLKTADGKPTDYGLGFGTANDDQLGRLVAHSGGAVGGRSYLLLAPDAKRIVVAISGNVEGESFKPQAIAIARLFRR